MILHKHLIKTISPFMGMITLFITSACGSYEYASSDQDGIYASEPEARGEQQPVLTQNERNSKVTETKDSEYYANYFEQESEKIQKAQDMMFTDVDSYSSNRPDSTSTNDTYYSEDQIAYSSGNSTWGSNPSEINVNYYNTGYTSPYYYNDYRFGWGYPMYGISFSWGWHSPYGWFYNPYYYNPYYYAYNPYYYNPYYYNPYYVGYNRYYGRQTAYHPTYRNNYRSNDYDRGAARSQTRSGRNYSQGNTRSATDRTTRSGQNDRTRVNATERIRNPHNINAGNRTRANSSNDRAVRSDRTTTRTRSIYPSTRTRSNSSSTRTRSNNTSTRTRSSSNSNNSGTNVRTRTYSPAPATRSSRSSSSSSRRGGR